MNESVAKRLETRKLLGPRYPRSEPARRGTTSEPPRFRFDRVRASRAHPTRDST